MEELNQDDDEYTGSGRGFRWMMVVFLGFILMGFLAFTLWHRVMMVDPVQRCADAYESSYTMVDTTLVDRMKVRSPNDGEPRTTCRALRLDGSIDKLPRREMRPKMMP